MKIGLNRNKINIEVCDKVFKIGIFPIICESLIVKNDLIEKAWEEQKEHTLDDINAKNKAQYDIQFEIVENLLLANGYDFDKDWWLSHVDMLGLSEFIVFSKMKDVDPTKLKKKEVIQGH